MDDPDRRVVRGPTVFPREGFYGVTPDGETDVDGGRVRGRKEFTVVGGVRQCNVVEPSQPGPPYTDPLGLPTSPLRPPPHSVVP